MILEQLREEVLRANVELVRAGLVTLTWGNVSGIHRSEGLVVIKPSGIDYESLTPADMVVVDLDGKVVEGTLRPSTDTLTHVKLYKAFTPIGGITHSHSLYATMFAQACCEIPCFGTTHADHFDGSVPVTRFLAEAEVESGYESNTGVVIIERFASLDVMNMPAVLVAGHAPFVWGKSASDSVNNSIALERVAQMALGTLQLNPDTTALPKHILEKHYQRKHGPDAYYGQKK
jgi:L-ribulose-5-phosphate 4-epimerase